MSKQAITTELGQRVWSYATEYLQTTIWLALIWSVVATASAQTITANDLLPVEEAFALEAERTDDSLVLDWAIAPGYYLYRHAFEFASDTAELGEPQIPQGEVTTDEFFGETETYRERVRVVVPIQAAPAGVMDVRVVSQGCADLGVCYPPHRQLLRLGGPAVGVDVLTTSAPSALDGLLGSSAGALPAEDAFSIEAIATASDALLLRLRSAPNYYIYRDSLAVSVSDPAMSVDGLDLPEAQPINDAYFGDTFVYYDEVEVPVGLIRGAGEAQSQSQSIDVDIDFQGCLTAGICYPPMTRSLVVELPKATEASRPVRATQTATRATGGSEQDRLALALSETPILALALFLLAGVLLAFTPCVFPMVPILSGLIAGEGDEINTGRAFRLSLVYVLSMALVYTAFGVVAGVFGQNLQAVFQHPAVLITFAALFAVLSLAMFGFYELQLPSRVQTKLNELSNRTEGGTLMGAAIMGALSALVVGPCVAPALMGALIYIGQTGDAVLGGAALFSMAMGMGIPLMVWGTSAGKLLPRAGAWMNAVKAVFGVGLLALAIWMLERILPGAVVMALWGSLAIACAVYLGALTRLDAGVSGWRKLWQALGIILLVLGIAQWLGALSGGRDWTRPLGHVQTGGASQTVQAPTFAKVETLDQLQSAVAAAQAPVFLDFYADWCVDCVRMERRTFVDPAVATRMGEFALIKVDVTAYNSDHQAILSHFGLIGPPALLFFSQGQELGDLRRFGFMPPNEFLAHLDQVAQAAAF